MYSAGNVVQIRLNTEDVLGCIDVIKQSNVETNGMSLAMVVRLVLSAYLEGSRINGTIPRRDGFEYNEMIAPFMHTNKAKKMQTTNVVLATELARVKVDMPAAQFHIQSHGGEQPRQLSDEVIKKKGRVLTRILELQAKREADPDNFNKDDHMYMSRLEDAIQQIDDGQDVDLSKLL